MRGQRWEKDKYNRAKDRNGRRAEKRVGHTGEGKRREMGEGTRQEIVETENGRKRWERG
jgi:hypothetical protein